MKKVFLHGLESSSQGTKARYFNKIFQDFLIPDFKGDLNERMEQLHCALTFADNLVIVGSSFGGLMATIYTQENPILVQRLILLAPALNFPEFTAFQDKNISVETLIYHGSDDTVTPIDIVQPIVERIFLDFKYNIVNDDHSLHKTFSDMNWKSLLA